MKRFSFQTTWYQLDTFHIILFFLLYIYIVFIFNVCKCCLHFKYQCRLQHRIFLNSLFRVCFCICSAKAFPLKGWNTKHNWHEETVNKHIAHSRGKGALTWHYLHFFYIIAMSSYLSWLLLVYIIPGNTFKEWCKQELYSAYFLWIQT